MESDYAVSAEAQNDLGECWGRGTPGRTSHTGPFYSFLYILFWLSICQTCGLSASWLFFVANET